MQRRRRVKQPISFKDRLIAFSDKLRHMADDTPPGPKRDELEKKLRQAEVAVEIDGWTNSHDLQPPK
jgi:hypothetical protein